MEMQMVMALVMDVNGDADNGQWKMAMVLVMDVNGDENNGD